MKAIIMLMIYKSLRFVALHTNSYVSTKLYKLWFNVIGGEWAEGLITTGHMCKISDLEKEIRLQKDKIKWEEVKLDLV